MAKKKNKKIVRYRKPLNINVGMIIFALIFVYMAFSVYTYMRKEKVQFYEVVEGSIVNDKSYTGIALREEQTKYTDRAGYINYYVREGKRASVGTSIYSIDETGALAAFLEEHADEGTGMSSEGLSDIKKQLSAFSLSYSDDKFSSVYDAKYTLEATVLEYSNFSSMENMDTLMKEKGISFQQVRADQAGVISYAIDSYEDLTESGISEAVFDRTNYSKAITKTGLIDKEAPVYKVITSDSWSLVFPMSEEDITAFADKKNLQVSFTGHDLVTTGAFSRITGTDGKAYGKLDFNKYMVEFVSDRYIDFEILSDKVSGLKIPVSAITKKDFYLVPIEYLAQGGDSSETGFFKETYGETGTSAVFIPTTLYYATDEFYYIDSAEDGTFTAGDYIVKPNSTDRYQIGQTASLEGVYNINKGYSVFKQIEILDSNDEYCTVKKNMKYGLSVYDHIVLDASIIEKEGVLIYQ